MKFEKVKVSLFFVVVSVLIVFAQAGLTFFGGEDAVFLINLMYVALAFVASLACFVACRVVSSKVIPQIRAFWFLLGVAFLLFTLGDAYWAYQEVVLGNLAPLGTFADACWMLAYGVWIGALFWFISLWRRPSQKLLFAFVLLMIVTPGVLYFSGVLTAITFGGVITALYVALDIALLLMVGYCFLRGLDEGRNVVPWMFFLAAIIARLLFDFLYSGMVSLDVYETGGAIDLLYSMSYAFITFAANDGVYRPIF